MAAARRKPESRRKDPGSNNCGCAQRHDIASFRQCNIVSLDVGIAMIPDVILSIS